jgi:thiamine biosynthesis lipoprotein
MGSPFTMTVFADDSLALLPIIEKAFARVDELNHIFSDYDSTSEISRLCREKAVYTISQDSLEDGEGGQKLSDDLYLMIKRSLEASRLSNGAFDITVGHIVKLWRQARKSKSLPKAAELEKALRQTGWRKIRLDTVHKKMSFYTARRTPTRGVVGQKAVLALDFGGIVKGFAAQEVSHILKENGYPICLVDAGGDMVLGNAPPLKSEGVHENKDAFRRDSAWLIGLTSPQSDVLMPQFLYLKNQAIATSGDLYQSVRIDGKTYSHIVHPKTGLGLTHQRQVTAIANDGATADWLATACSVLPIRKAKRLVKKIPHAALLILEKRKGKILIHKSAAKTSSVFQRLSFTAVQPEFGASTEGGLSIVGFIHNLLTMLS